MRNLKSILIVALAVFAFACSQKPVIDYTLISGTLENYTSGELVVMGNDRSEIKITVAEDGTFADTIRKEGELYLILDKANIKIYALNGAVLNLVADANNFTESVVISGEKAGMSNYLLRKAKNEKEVMGDMRAAFSLEEAEFWANAKKLLAKQEAELKNVSDITEELRNLEQRALKASYISSLGMFEAYHGFLTQNKEFKASEELQKEASEIDYNDGKLYEYSQDYQRLLMNDSYEKAGKLVESGEASSLEMGNLMVAEKIENETIREAMLFAAVASSFARAENKDELYERYMAAAKNEEKRAEITQKFEAVSKLDKGKPSPKFFDYENYAGGTSSLDDFKGKYVYIDVWATWCGPCKAEIPYLKKVEEKYHGKNIEFVSISVDKEKDKQTWKEMIAEKQMGGVQLITQERDFMDAYVISGIPRFILIDPDGNIVSKNAPRPSDEKLIDLFNKLRI